MPLDAWCPGVRKGAGSGAEQKNVLVNGAERVVLDVSS